MEETVMQKPRAIKIKILMVAALLHPACGLAQIGGNSGTGASSTGSRATTGIASDQAHISPPGINSLGTAIRPVGRAMGPSAPAWNRETAGVSTPKSRTKI
jgi:hypothetical protein